MENKYYNHISKNFTLQECIKSDTATKYKINNLPNEEQFKNICNGINNLLQPIRDKLNKPIHINSCFRCEELNNKIGGAKNSHHLCNNGYSAFDIITEKINSYDLANIILELKIPFCQLICEYKSKNNNWVHISYNEKDLRNECLSWNGELKKYYNGIKIFEDLINF